VRSQVSLGIVRTEHIERIESWARYWVAWSSAAYLRGYMEAANAAPILPQTPEEVEVLLDSFLVEKALYEIAYELNNRPD